jgi:branched-chain amino acid transport system substrate-binding protein
VSTPNTDREGRTPLVRGSTARRRAALIVGAVLFGSALAACSSSSSSSSSSASSAASPATSAASASAAPAATEAAGTPATGSPVTIGTIVPVDNPVESYPDLVAALRAGALDLNAHGGIAGHKIVIDFCNSNGTANGETSCATKLVSDHVAAAVGDLTPFSPDTTSILNAGGIPEIGIVPETQPGEFNSPNVFIFDGGPAYDYAAMPILAKQVGLKSIAIVGGDNAANDPINSLSQVTAASQGIDFKGIVTLPLTTPADFTPYAAQVQKLNPDLVSIPETEPNVIGIMKAMTSLGADSHYSINNTILQNSDYAELGSAANNLYIVGRIPPFSAASEFPGLQHFIADMKAEQATGDSAADISTARAMAVEPWLGLYALSEAMKGATTVTPASITTAMNSAKDLNMQGIIPNWTPSTPGPKNYTRVSMAYDYFIKVENGNAVLLDKTPVNVGAIIAAG